MALDRLHLINPPARFEIRGSQLGGQGIFARSAILRGTSIFKERALFSITNVGGNLSRNNITEIGNKAGQHRGFQALSCTINPATPQARFETNRFDMDPEREGIFLQASRLNHSCIPNAHFAWNPNMGDGNEDPKGFLTVHAIRRIEQGEEILINYLHRDCYKPVGQRQHTFSSNYNLNCTCPACQQPQPGLGTENERHRRQMRTLHKRLKQINPNLQQPVDIMELISLLIKEGLVYPQLADAYDLLAVWYKTAMERSRNHTDSDAITHVLEFGTQGLRYAREKLDLDLMCTGHDSPEIIKTLALIREFDPQ